LLPLSAEIHCLAKSSYFAVIAGATVADLRDLAESCLERARDRLMIV
jgi:hypothetical protein